MPHPWGQGPQDLPESLSAVDAALAYIAGGTNTAGAGQVTTASGAGYLTLALDPGAAFGSVLFGVASAVNTPLVPGVPDTCLYKDVSAIRLATATGTVGAGVAWALRR